MIQQENEARLKELESRSIQYIDEIARRDSRIQALQIHIRELEVQIAHQKGVVAALRQLYHSVDDKIMRTLTERGQLKVKRPSAHPRIEEADSADYESLIKSARKYDTEEFFVLKAEKAKHHLRPGYRIVAKGYRTLRDGARASLKKAHRLKAGE